MNKKALVKKIVASLRSELEIYFRAAHSSRAEATHEQNKAENKYDTRGLEASYLARGQSKQAAELENSIVEFEKLELRSFGQEDGIDLSAMVELEHNGERIYYFIGPRAGGTEVVQEKKEVLVITPQSPLGAQLLGRKQGEKVQLSIAGSRSDYRVVTVE